MSRPITFQGLQAALEEALEEERKAFDARERGARQRSAWARGYWNMIASGHDKRARRATKAATQIREQLRARRAAFLENIDRAKRQASADIVRHHHRRRD